MYYIGIDGGGSQTVFGLFNEDEFIESQISETCHFLQVGFIECVQCLKKGILYFVDKYDIDIKQLKIGLGIAGYGSDDFIRKQFDEAFKEELSSYHYVMTSDMHIALLGALDGEDGIVVVAGTGSIAMAKCSDMLIRCGGWGYQLGDEGSAYWVGKQLLNIFTKQSDGRVIKDQIYDTIMSHYQCDNPYQMISIVNHFDNVRYHIARLALLCGFLSDENEYCHNIIKEAAIYICLLVKNLISYFDECPVISYYGGMFQNTLFKDTFLNEFKENSVIKPKHDALFGAYLYAKEYK